MKIAKEYGLLVVEDNAQALGAKYKFSDGSIMRAGIIGDIGCTSFFPSKNLGCYGDGGAIFTNNPELAIKMKMIANHGQRIKYHHDIIGCNSRLDTIQAAILDVKLKKLDEYEQLRYNAASYYSKGLIELYNYLITPKEMEYSTHVYHQYTLIINQNKRDELKLFLEGNGIPTMVYYPLSLDQQNAFKSISKKGEELINSNILSKAVLSLPIHSELTHYQQDFIIGKIIDFFNLSRYYL